MYLTSRSKSTRICATCQFWKGYSVRVKNPYSIEFDLRERAMCNKKGYECPSTRTACSEYEIRYDF